MKRIQPVADPRRALASLMQRATTLHKAGHVADALTLYLEAQQRAPENPAPAYYAGIAAFALGADDEAIRLMRSVVERMPDYADAHYNLAKCYHEHRTAPNLMRAEAHYQRAVELNPSRAEALCNLGQLYAMQGRMAECAAAWARALATEAAHPEARFNTSFLLLRRGQFADGWARYEARRQCDAFVAEYGPLSKPAWDGRADPAVHLVIESEQGAGDTLMFARWVPWATSRVGRVTLSVPGPLVDLLARSFPAVTVGTGAPHDATHACAFPSIPFLAGVASPADLWTGAYLDAA